MSSGKNAEQVFVKVAEFSDVQRHALNTEPEVIDFDLDVDSAGPETQPPEPREPAKRALIASADRNERLYLRARLALAELTQADEAETGAQALELTRAHQY
jgi:hypothetical protein